MGRPKGSRNLVTREVREKFTDLLEKQLPQLEKDFQALPARDRVRMILELAKFVVPQLKAVEAQIMQAENEPFDFNKAIARLRDEA